VVTSEPAKDKPLNHSTVKKFAGGGSVSGAPLYSDNTKVGLTVTLILECNESQI
jgi:phage/plasmid-associated DNA primase